MQKKLNKYYKRKGVTLTVDNKEEIKGIIKDITSADENVNNEETKETLNNVETESSSKTKEDSNKEKKQKSKAAKVTNIIVKTILWLIIAILVAFIARAIVFHKYDVFGHRLYVIMSGSMEPTIHVGDAIVTRESKTYEVGDVIAFTNVGEITAHRIIKKYTTEQGPLYQTQGDNNNVEDKGMVQDTQIKGKVIATISKGGDLVLNLRKYWPILVFAIMAIIIVFLVRRLI